MPSLPRARGPTQRIAITNVVYQLDQREYYARLEAEAAADSQPSAADGR